ncbi:penicillin-binding transpeptidase domain-containing protein [Brachybacterium kimchii]|uniref:Penicillin-binding transpeptidase domain-containing protein n=1 Tax=Brachybacterium kimchii TaxID=2942909 RepID=A0ABY4N464_9MICO|nr:penicillin-binding transpeptidase domain-containing protein [Brachybacterium kimchii]UQN29357.1 penicillin-binding transpeptidase domain-containing protein [Brachybacterium kimchii]
MASASSPSEPTPTRRRRGPIIAGISAVVVLALIAAFFIVRDRAGDGSKEAKALAAALASGDFSGVTLTGTDASGAKKEREKALGDLQDATGKAPSVDVSKVEKGDDGTRTATLDWSWTLPHDAGTWDYTTTATLTEDGDTWAASLDPSELAPDLTADETVSLRTVQGDLGSITDRDGDDLYGPREVRVLGIDKTQVDADQQQDAAKKLADLLGIDADTFAASVKSAGEKAFVPALTIRESAVDDYPLGKAADVPGYHEEKETQPLAVTKDFAPGVLGSLREATKEDIDESDGKIVEGDMVGSGGVAAAERDSLVGTPGVEVVAADPKTGKERKLHATDATAGKDVETTLDTDLQKKATEAIADQDSASAVVVMQPSTGDVLASALGPTGQSYPVGLVGQYAPGSTFKTVTALSLLRAGDTPDTTVECPATASVEGRSFKNADSMDKSLFGKMSLATAIAHSCNTAMLLQYDTVSQDKLADAATTLGIGQDAPEGLSSAFMGKVDPDDSGVEHAADMMGQGRVLTSPLSMATVLSSIQNGSTVRPRILADDDSKAPEADNPLTEDETSQLQDMLHGVVTEGTLKSTFGDVKGDQIIGKTGTAEWTDENGDAKLHSWVVVAQGDVVVVAFVEDGGYGATTAGPIAKEVLQDAQSEG